MKRTDTKTIYAGSVAIGGGSPVSVQSMTNTPTADVEATLSQIRRLHEAGCDIARLAVPDMDAARALSAICEGSPLPIVADIHFDYRLALAAVDAGVAKIRINPGNIGEDSRVAAVAKACSLHNIPIRIGVNGGSLEKNILEKYGLCAEALVESALGHVAILNRFDFDDICISIKSSNVPMTVEAYQMLAERTNYPLHLGITETGPAYMGLVKSAAGIGSMLLDGIGNTIRVSLTDDPVEEVKAGIAILKAVGLRTDGVNIISCPTCGRTEYDLFATVQRVEERLKNCKNPLTVAVMGCVVNGPGEAKHADYGVAGGRGCGVLFKHGEVVGKVSAEHMADALADLIESELNGNE